MKYGKFVVKSFKLLSHISVVKKSYTSEIVKLGKKIKKMREAKGMTQQHLSDLCQVDIRTIQRVEKGEFGAGLHIIYSIADAFEITVSELLS